jgi:addiction module RelE/StbE family toxin
MWKQWASNRFKKGYRKISNEMVERVKKAVKKLVESEHPERYGVPKKGNLSGYYAWELGRQCRILFKPHYDENTIEFARVCSHKESYG